MKNGNRETISVIVPIYKVERYLNRCVESIVRQTYQNLEIILVDDGSPDRCPAICDAWARKDQRIRVIHKQNGGLSDARNAGIDLAKGGWLAFVDSDDYLELNMYERMLGEADDTQADMVICNFYWQSLITHKRVHFNDDKTYTNMEYLNLFFVDKPVESTVAWNKLYKRELFFADEYIRYPVGKLHEDEFTTYKLIYSAKTIRVISDALYHYVQREKSIMSSFTTKNLQNSIEAIKEYIPWIKEKHLDLRRQIACTYDMLYISFYFRILDNRALDPQGEILKDFRKYILVNTPSIWHDAQFSVKKRILDFLVRTNTVFVDSWYRSLKRLLK